MQHEALDVEEEVVQRVIRPMSYARRRIYGVILPSIIGKLCRRFKEVNYTRMWP
jgi:hypothetical protein